MITSDALNILVRQLIFAPNQNKCVINWWIKLINNDFLQNIALEGYSEDDNQDGFVDPIGQVAPVAYAAPVVHAAPAVTYAAPAVTYAHAPAITYAHAPVTTYTHTVHAGNLVHTYAGPHYFGGLPVVAAAAAPAEEEAVKEA